MDMFTYDYEESKLHSARPKDRMMCSPGFQPWADYRVNLKFMSITEPPPMNEFMGYRSFCPSDEIVLFPSLSVQMLSLSNAM